MEVANVTQLATIVDHNDSGNLQGNLGIRATKLLTPLELLANLDSKQLVVRGNDSGDI